MIRHITFITMASALFLAPMLSYAAVTDATHYWKFDDGEGKTVLDSVGGKNGAIVGSSTGLGWAGGKANVSLAMDGGQYTGVNIPGLTLSGSVGTISLWLKLSTLSDQNVIWSARSTTDNNVYIALMVDREGRPMIQYRDAASEPDRRTQATKILNKDEWYHLVFSATGNAYRFTINGEEVGVAGDGNGRWFPDITNHTLEYKIGMIQSNALSGSFSGYIDDVRLFPRVLSLEEARMLYDETNVMMPTLPAAALPQVALSPSALSVMPGEAVVLSWGGKNVDTCTKGGGWTGGASISGSESTPKLNAPTTYSISCIGKNGSASSSVTISMLSPGMTLSPVVPQEIVIMKPMTETERQALIVELKKKIMELIMKLQQLLLTQQSQKTN